MHRIFRVKAYEKEHGPHFNEEYARKAVMKMENEDGTRGPHLVFRRDYHIGQSIRNCSRKQIQSL